MKRKILAALLSVCLFVGLAVPAFAEENSTAPWTAGSGSVTAAEGGKWLLMGSETASEGMYQGPYVKWTDSIGDISNGLTMSVTLDASNIKLGELFGWTFAVDGQAPADNRLAEVLFDFQSEKAGEAKLLSVAGKVPASTVKGSLFNIKVTFNAGAEGKLSATATVNGTKITLDGETLTSPGGNAETLYSAVTGPRYGWLCSSTVTEGILATTPTAVAVTPIVNPITKEKYDNITKYFANGTPIVIDENGDNGFKIYDENDNLLETCDDSTAYVFGGSHWDGTGEVPHLTATKVTVRGGKIAAVIAGNLHGGVIDNTTLIIEGGDVRNAYASSVGRSGFSDKVCPEGEPFDDKDRTLVHNANLTVSGGTIGMLYGGNMGYGHTENVNAKMTDGSVGYGVVTGSNGQNDNVTFTMTGGEITKELLGLNHGFVNNTSITIDENAKVNQLFALSDEPESNSGDDKKANRARLTGAVTLTIKGGKVNELLAGYMSKNPKNEANQPVTAAGIIKGEYKRSSVKNYTELLTTEAFGTAFAKLLPIEITTQVENIDTSGKNDTEIQEAVADATKDKVNDGTIQNGDTAFAATAKAPDNVTADKKTEVEGKIQALLTATENVPAAENVQKENATDKTITYLVSNLSKVEASEDGVLQSVTFDVTPYEHEVGGTDAPVAKETLGKTITFRLPIPADWNDTPYVKVDHEGTITYHDVETVEGSTDKKYIEVSASSFSPFILTPSATRPAPTPTPTPSYSSGGVSSEFYVTVIAGANGKAKEAEGFYARDERHTFTMVPDEGYVIDTVTLDDGSVLSHTDTEFVLFVDEPYEVHVTFKKAAGSTTTADKPAASKNPQTGDSWFSGLF